MKTDGEGNPPADADFLLIPVDLIADCFRKAV